MAIKISLKTQAALLSVWTAVFVLSHFPTLENDFYKETNKKIRNALVVIGLGQNWNMFSPNPVSENARVFAKVIMKSGEVREWRPPGFPAKSEYEKYVKEHWRKWSMDNVRVDRNSFLWPRTAEYIAESHLKPGETTSEVDHVELWREWSQIPMPQVVDGKRILLPKKDVVLIPWGRYKFYEKRFD